MDVTLVPLLGPFHLRLPTFNAVTVRDIVNNSRPDAVAVTSLAPNSFATPAWQDTPEIALPLAVVPWCRRRDVSTHPVYEAAEDADAERDFERYLAQFAQTESVLSEVAGARRKVAELLEQPLSPRRITGELVGEVDAYQRLREAHFGDGPGTGWLRCRCMAMARRIHSLPHRRVTVLASLDHVPMLAEELSKDAKVTWPSQVEVSEASRRRALLDYAFNGEAQDPAKLVEQLREIDEPEARFHEANVLLAAGHVQSAREVMQALVNGPFHEPYFLPGFALARLGQLYDLSGDRELARRAYRGVLALEWAPRESIEAAEKGLEHPLEAPAEQPGAEGR